MKYNSILLLLMGSIAVLSMGCQNTTIGEPTSEQPAIEKQQATEEFETEQQPLDNSKRTDDITPPDNGQKPPMDGERPEEPMGHDGNHAMGHHDLSEEDQQLLLERVQGLNYDNLMDGTYYGEAEGFGPGMKVEVIIEDSNITAVNIIEHNEREERFYGPAMAQIPQVIIETQSTSVDIVSGATYTSIGILEAVEKALEEAVGN